MNATRAAIAEQGAEVLGPLDESRLLLVDDEEAILRMVRRMLEKAGYRNVECVTDPREALERIGTAPPDILLLDLRMGEMDGEDVLDRLPETLPERTHLPVIVLTSDTSREARERVFSRGASHFVSKPVSPAELRFRVRNLLETSRLRKLLEHHNERLEDKVRERTAELEEARIEILERLALAAEYRDDDTGAHTRRVGLLARDLGTRVGIEGEDLESLRRAAPLHDIGKIGIPDRILLKPGELTDQEFEAIKEHTIIGEQILSGSRFPVLRMATRIARSHHENWDGSGYPDGLAGEEIPLTARIVAVADVFDSLTHERVYKEASPPEEALAEIRGLVGTKFDPAVAGAFFDAWEQGAIRELSADGEGAGTGC